MYKLSMHSHSVSKGYTNKWRVTVLITENESVDIVIKVNYTTIASDHDIVKVYPRLVRVDINDAIGGTERLVDLGELVDAYNNARRG